MNYESLLIISLGIIIVLGLVFSRKVVFKIKDFFAFHAEEEEKSTHTINNVKGGSKVNLEKGHRYHSNIDGVEDNSEVNIK